MRNYWLRIALGATAIFVAGMVGVTFIRHGIVKVNGVVKGQGPISIPLAFVPFNLEGNKLGTVKRVVLLRDAPKRITGVELQVNLTDSILARGLEGCRLAANLDEEHDTRGVQIHGGPFSRGAFSCLRGDDSTAEFRDFGRAVFQPGAVSVPLLLPSDMVDDLKRGDFNSSDQDSVAAAAEAQADSIAEEAEARADSISSAAERHADSVVASSGRLIDSLRKEGLRRADSTRRAASRVADTVRRP